MNKIYLVGYMGAGKSTTARRLANRLGWEVVDTDAMFEEKYKISVNDFFNKYDEPLYRKLESEVLKATERLENVVIATGGGTACYFDNMEWMNAHGLTVFMRISPQAAVDRVIHSRHKRPLAVGKSEEELTEFVKTHYAGRLPFYEQARLTVKSEDLDIDSLVVRLVAEGIDALRPSVHVIPTEERGSVSMDGRSRHDMPSKHIE
jgi:shikimate kinase